MNDSERQRYDAQRKLDDKPFKAACYAPWTSLYFNTNGDVIACCKNTNYVFGNVRTTSLDDIWRGQRVAALRRAMAAYNFGLGCQFCEWQIRGEQYATLHAAHYDELPVDVGQEWPRRMEFALSNTCNLACVMCYGVLSSTIRSQREKLPPLPRAYDDQFFQDLSKYLPHLERAAFLGGEPFLMQESYRIWDMMIEQGLSTPCHVTTNGTQFGRKVERVLAALPVHISVSMDGTTRQTVESIRVNAKFDEVLANVHRFRDYTRQRGTTMTLTYCLMRENWHEFADYLVFGNELDVPVSVNTVVHPDQSSLFTLTTDELADVVNRMESGAAGMDLGRNARQWQSTIATLREQIASHQPTEVAAVKGASSRMRKLEGNDPLRRAGECIESGQFDKALRELDEAPADVAEGYEAVTMRGRALRQLGRVAEAESALDAAIGLWGRAPNAYLERAWLRLFAGRFEEAVADARLAENAIDGDFAHALAPELLDVLGLCLANTGRHDEAIAAMDRLRQLRPLAAGTHVHRAWVCERAGRLGEAHASIAAALRLEPDHVEAAALRDRLGPSDPA